MQETTGNLEFTACALCAVGAEKVVSNELKKLLPRDEGGRSGCTILESGFGKVRFTTDLAGLYRSLMGLRAADRVLLEAGNFPAPDFGELFEKTKQIPWEDYIPRGMGLHVSKVRSNRSALKAETAIQSVVHKAAADRLCECYGISRLPGGAAGNSGAAGRSMAARNTGAAGHGMLIKRARQEAPQAELRVYLEKGEASLLLDLSGEPLFKRGYRRSGGIAPLRETTAAAIILLSGWKRKYPLWDPLCGSGTIVIEAALYAWDIAPGLGRSFALSEFVIGDRKLEARIRQELAAGADLSRPVRIFGSDAEDGAVKLAAANLKRALVPGLEPGTGPETAGISIIHMPLDEARAEGMGEGFIITNPPYGRRLGDSASAEEGYRNMAVLAKNFPRWKLALICDHAGFESHFGRKAGRCRELKSGAVETYLYEYEEL